MKNSKGITLIALIITIIVMMILAGVTISMTVGENGVISEAEKTKEVQEMATEMDRIQVAFADAQIKGMKKEVTWENFENSLIKEFGNNAELVNERNDYFLVKVNENEYTVYKSGKVKDGYELVIEKIEDDNFDITSGGYDSGEFKEDTEEVTFVVYEDKNFEGVVNFPDYVEKDGKRYKVTQIGYHYAYKFSEVILPLGVEKLKSSLTSGGDYTFHVCNNLKKVTLSKNTTVIGEKCFYVCDSLKEIVMNSKLHTIEAQAFVNCNSLEEITIPKSVTTIGETIFSGCNNLKKIKVENTSEYIKNNLSNLSVYSGIVYDINGNLVIF